MIPNVVVPIVVSLVMLVLGLTTIYRLTVIFECRKCGWTHPRRTKDGMKCRNPNCPQSK